MKDHLPFDREEGESRKEEGMDRVLNNAPLFKDEVRRVIAHLADTRERFTGDHVRKLCQKWGIAEPHHPNAWGASMSAAAKRGEIIRVDHQKSAAVSRHAGMHGVWTKQQPESPNGVVWLL